MINVKIKFVKLLAFSTYFLREPKSFLKLALVFKVAHVVLQKSKCDTI